MQGCLLGPEGLELGERPERVGPLPEAPLAPEAVDRPVPRGRRDPRTRVRRDAALGPGSERLGDRVLDRALREVEVAEDPDQGRDRPPLLLAEQVVDDLANVGGYDGASESSMIGRTSIEPPRATDGILEAASIASSRFAHSIR